MTDKMIRTRFAPSPTGFLHLGGARTALFCYLFARRYQGQFILRIEDTDLARSTEESIQAILQSMEWLGLDFDEGPYYQTQRFDRYKEVIDQLLQEGKAYRCYCTKERLDALRAEQLENKVKPKYDGRCRDLTEHDDRAPYVIRFRSPEAGQVCFHDLVRGDIAVENAELDDLIIARTDGSPTYNFTVVIDDWDMQITHVIRGDDHINNTPRQINIFKALGADIPSYAHVPMILGQDGKRLSKRHAAVSVMEYRDEGYLPEALLNYLVRLGWAHGDQELFSREEMIALFDLNGVSHSPARFDMEKLGWLNQQYMKSLAPEWGVPELQRQLLALGIDAKDDGKLRQIILLQAERCKTLAEMANASQYFFRSPERYDEKAVRKFLKPELTPVLQAMKTHFLDLKTWEKAPIHDVIVSCAEQFTLKMGKVAQPLRIAMTGATVSPSIDSTLMLIGKAAVLKRLDTLIAFMAGIE